MEAATSRHLTVDYTKSVKETFFSLVRWAVGSRHFTIRFACVVAESLDLYKFEWSDYTPESTIESKDERSPTFVRLVSRPLKLFIRCRSLRRWYFQRLDHFMVAHINSGAFKKAPSRVYLPFIDNSHSSLGAFELFALESSSVLLAWKDKYCVGRAYSQPDYQKMLRL
jgi:hypothetical protein